MTHLSLGSAAPRPAAAAAQPLQWWRRPLLIAHIVTAIGLIGVDLALLSLGLSGLGGADPQAVYPAASQVSSVILAPLVIAALPTGIAQALLLRWGLVRYWWVAVKLAVTVILTGVVWFVLVPQLAASADAAVTGQTFTIGERLPLALAPAVAIALVIMLAALAIYKPGGRVRGGEEKPR